MSIEAENPESAQSKHLLLGTVSFTVCFAAWGLISAFAPRFRQQFHLSATQTAFLVAVPVLLGALARIPIGMLADRFGGRVVFTVLMLFVAVPVALVPAATSYRNLLVVAFLLGMAGSSFAVGVGYVSRWFSMESQGSALGVYGLGNIGQSAAVFLGPVVAAAYGYRSVYWGMSVILLVWAGVFVVLARNAPHAARPKGLSEMLGVLAREPLAWALAAFYFLTFGGFVAFSIYLPTLLRDQFGLKTRGCRFPNSWIRCAGHALPPARWLAIRPHWRIASSFMDSARSGCLRIVARCAVDASIHRWSARMRRLARHRQWRCISACASIFPNPTSHGHRTGGRDGRDGGILPAFASRRVS